MPCGSGLAPHNFYFYSAFIIVIIEDLCQEKKRGFETSKPRNSLEDSPALVAY